MAYVSKDGDTWQFLPNVSSRRKKLPTFARILRQLRLSAEFTQRELAARAGIPCDTLRALEYGRRPCPQWDTVCALADALGCAVDDFREESQ